MAIIHPNEMVVPEAITELPVMHGVGFNDLPKYVALGKEAAAARRDVSPRPSQSKDSVLNNETLNKLLESSEYNNYLTKRKKSNIIMDANGLSEFIGSKEAAKKRISRAFY